LTTDYGFGMPPPTILTDVVLTPEAALGLIIPCALLFYYGGFIVEFFTLFEIIELLLLLVLWLLLATIELNGLNYIVLFSGD